MNSSRGRRHHASKNGKNNGNRGPSSSDAERSKLVNMRVVQRNLVYVIGLSPAIADEEVLRRDDFFGQYGKIVSIATRFAFGRSRSRFLCISFFASQAFPPASLVF